MEKSKTENPIAEANRILFKSGATPFRIHQYDDVQTARIKLFHRIGRLYEELEILRTVQKYLEKIK